jgi:hypothetical protein
MLDSQSMFVDKYYEMMPAFDDLLPSGRDLRDGMIVLIESPLSRADVDVSAEELTPSLKYVARVLNRWCTVSDIKFEMGGAILTFIGEYGDGVKVKRNHQAADAWIVKLDSLPDH